MARQLKRNVLWLQRAEAPILAGLTGGKDSRLVLAMLQSAGLANGVKFFLSVPPTHADFVSASAVASVAGVDFERRDLPPKSDFFDTLLNHVAFTDCALNAWDLRGGTQYISQIGVHGLFGEYYRGRGATPTSLHAATRALTPNFDRTSVAHPEFGKATRGRLRKWFDEIIELGVPRTMLREAYYRWQFLARWAGQARMRDNLSGMLFNPLYHPMLLRSYSALSREDRDGERVHFELMLRLSPQLAGLPFANDCWNRKMVLRSSAPSTLLSEAVHHQAPLIGQGWAVPTLKEHWPMIRAQIAGRSSDIEPIADPRRVSQLLDAIEIVLDISRSPLSRLRALVPNPYRFFAASKFRDSAVKQVLGLLTVLAAYDEINAEEPRIVHVE